jgi:hypothetical protein
LRRKIDDGEKVALFKTIRGTGFMLDSPSPPRRTAPIALGRAKSSRERG